MDLLIRSAIILDPNSPNNGKRKDILIKRGVIQSIANRISNPGKIKEVTSDDLHISPGWVDTGVHFCDPGLEHHEDLASGQLAAAAGGFTSVGVLPNTDPAVHSKSQVEYIVKQGKNSIVDLMPIGALTKDCAGKEITEMYDMREAGAVAFSDGLHSSQSAGIMERSLLYVKPFDGLVVNRPEEETISNRGLMHEGEISTSLGLNAIPSVAEELSVMRDIYLVEYTDSRLHFSALSAKRSLEHIKKAKRQGLAVTCGVNMANLVFDHQVLASFDPNYKVLPPLRAKADLSAMIRGLKDGTIDVINSGHIPVHQDGKKLEFEYADYGMLGLETAFGMYCTYLADDLGLELFIEKIMLNPRRILKLEIPEIKDREYR